MLRMTPSRPSAMQRRASSVLHTKVPSSTIPVTARQPLKLRSSAGTGKLPAALLTSTSTGPRREVVTSNARATASGSRMSHATPIALPPAPSTARTPAARCSSSRLAIASAAPRRANSTAIARPSPVPPPVMSTTLPRKVPSGSIASPRGGGSASPIGVPGRGLPALGEQRQLCEELAAQAGADRGLVSLVDELLDQAEQLAVDLRQAFAQGEGRGVEFLR